MYYKWTGLLYVQRFDLIHKAIIGKVTSHMCSLLEINEDVLFQLRRLYVAMLPKNDQSCIGRFEVFCKDCWE